MARSRVDTCLGRVKRCFSHALIFAAQVCAIYVVILLSGLLVFWSAIFIDSKGRKFSRQEDSRILRKHHREIGKTMAINRVTIMGNLTRDAELRKRGCHECPHLRTRHQREEEGQRDRRICRCAGVCRLRPVRCASRSTCSLSHQGEEGFGGRTAPLPLLDEERGEAPCPFRSRDRYRVCGLEGCRKDTVSAKGQSAEPETYDADIPF